MLFQMTEPLRQSLISQHIFYVEQAQARLLLQFSELNTKESAEQFIKSWMKENQYRFNPSFHDEGDFYAEACERYHALLALGNQTRLSVVAGLYHEWDKQLRQWLTGEVRRWHDGEFTLQQVWSKDIGKLLDLLENLGWYIRSKPYFNKLDACRLVVNVYKHGKGNSLNDLKKGYPEFLPNPFPNEFSFSDYLEHTYLVITDTQLQDFSNAIIAFWADAPKDIFDADSLEVPQWLAEALEKDQASAARSET